MTEEAILTFKYLADRAINIGKGFEKDNPWTFSIGEDSEKETPSVWINPSIGSDPG